MQQIIRDLRTLQKLVDRIIIRPDCWVGIDTEGTSLNPRKNKLLCVQIGVETSPNGEVDGYIIPLNFARKTGEQFRFVPPGSTESPIVILSQRLENQLTVEEFMKVFRVVLETPTVQACYSGSKYDMRVFLVQEPTLLIRHKVWDTICSSALLHRQPKGLKDRVMLDLGIRMIPFNEKFPDPTSLQYQRPEDILDYAIPDCINVVKLARNHEAAMIAYERPSDPLHEVHKRKRDLLHRVEGPCTIYLAYMEHIGIKVDVPYFAELKPALNELYEQALEEFYELIGCAGKLDLKPNVASGDDLIDYLMHAHGHWSEEDAQRTESGEISCNRAALEAFINSDKSTDTGAAAAHKILEIRELSKIISTYINLPTRFADEDDRIRTTFKQFDVVSWRLAAAEPNLHQVPTRTEHGKKIRKAFIAADGYVLGVTDFDGCEARIGAGFSQDPNKMAVYTEGKDAHVLTAVACGFMSQELADKMAYGTATKEEMTAGKSARSSGKTVNYAMDYGSGKRKLGLTLNGKRKDKLNKKQVERIYNAYWEQYKVYKTWKTGKIEETKRRKFAVCAAGYSQDFRQDIKSGFHIDNSAANFQIQPVAGLLIKKAQREILNWCMENRWLCMTREQVAISDLPEETREKVLAHMRSHHWSYIRLVEPLLQVHDELVFSVFDDAYIRAEFKSACEQRMLAASAGLRIPVPAELGYGTNWLEAK